MVRLALLTALILGQKDPFTSIPRNPSTPTKRPAAKSAEADRKPNWLADPRNAVLLTLGSLLLVGGGRRWLKSRQARIAAERLAEADVTVNEILAAAKHGREGLIDLFRLLGDDGDVDRRNAAGRAIASLWKQDELIVEEEQALVRRGYAVAWRARRRYPRELTAPIGIAVDFGVPFLRASADEVGPENFAWSYRITGAERASLEEFTPWTTGQTHTEFLINPTDFASNGPHRLAFIARVRSVGLTDSWQLDLPHVAFSFELDPLLRADALLTLEDEARGASIAAAIRLENDATSGEASRLVGLNDELVLRDPPVLVIATPLTCDLAHALWIEFEGSPGRYPAGSAVVAGQGVAGAAGERRIRFEPTAPIPREVVEKPGEIKLRVVLTADPHRGWADPDVRSIWPGEVVTAWTPARVVRR